MKDKVKAPNLVVIAILSVITIVFWIGFSVFRAFTKEPDPKVPAEILAPLNPTLDLEALNRLERRNWLTESEIGDTQLVLPTTTPQPSPSALELLEEEEVTSSAETLETETTEEEETENEETI